MSENSSQHGCCQGILTSGALNRCSACGLLEPKLYRFCNQKGVVISLAVDYSVRHATHTDWRSQTEDSPRSGDGDGSPPARRDRATENRGTEQTEHIEKYTGPPCGSSLRLLETPELAAHSLCHKYLSTALRWKRGPSGPRKIAALKKGFSPGPLEASFWNQSLTSFH